MPATIHELAVLIHERRDDPIPTDKFPAHFYLDAGLNLIGGCELCEATLAAYNAYPSRSGYWRCSDCIGDTGFTLEEAYQHVHLNVPLPPVPKPLRGHWGIPGGRVWTVEISPHAIDTRGWLEIFGTLITGSYWASLSKGHEHRRGGAPRTKWDPHTNTHYVR